LKFAVMKMLVFCVGTAIAAQASAQSVSGPLQNWFNDPFFQFTSVVTDCPEPLGPRITAEDRASQAHRRAEKGTSCWLAGTCDKPNAYAYDADIAVALKSLLERPQLFTHSPLVNSSLWATVQGRIVTIEGCVAGDVPSGYDRALLVTQIEKMVSSVPNVLQVVALIRTGVQALAGERVPYRVRP
jgi:hypothetical protein